MGMTDYLEKPTSLSLQDALGERLADQAMEWQRAAVDPGHFQADPEREDGLGEADLLAEGLVDPVAHGQAPASDRTPDRADTLRASRPGRAASGGLKDRAASSPDLFDAYLRQMGAVEPLSREDELALAKRVEAKQLAVLEGLCRVPMLVERIRLWVGELQRGERRLHDLIDLAGSEIEADAEAPAETDGNSASVADAPGRRETGLQAETITRLEHVCALAQQIGLLSRRQAAVVARGCRPAKRNRAQLDALLAQAASEMAHLRLHPDRVVELAELLEQEQKHLRGIERDLVALAKRGRIVPADATDRAFEAERLSEAHWEKLTHLHSVRVTALREELSEMERRVGLPLAEFRAIASRVSQAQRDAKSAREEMVRQYLPLVISIAMKYRGKSSLDPLDLIQEGNLGLMRAVEKYDYRRGVKVATYAVWWIRQAITRAMADRGRMIRVPVHMTGTAARVSRERRRLYQQQGREPTAAEIAAHAAMPVAHVEKALSLVREPTSLDAPVGEDGDATLADLIEAPDALNPLAAMEASALKEHLAEALSELTPREERVLRMRFGIGDVTEHTLEEVGKVFGVTRERIRQIEAQALQKLRHPARGRRLSAFAEG
jgi:RNA polymerase primary sigma factor